jgi:hypothetical protein
MNLLEMFNQLDAEAIKEFIQQGQEEHLYLDFKTVSNANLNGADHKKNLAKAISGFANSSGGLIVWGVDARKNPRGIDCATGLDEISPIQFFVSRLNTLTGESVSPLVDGIIHKPISIGGEKGCAVTLVPESQLGPHMAKLGEDRYYKRSGDSFYRMEHFDLEDMFGRRQKPMLGIQMNPRRCPEEDLNEELDFYLINTGRAIAKHAGIIATFDASVSIVNVTGQLQNISALNNGRPTLQYVNDISVVHPNGIRLQLGCVKFRRVHPEAAFGLHLLVYCENMKAQSNQCYVAPLPMLTPMAP